jgi:hypothetical protein
MATVNEGLFRYSMTDYDKQRRQVSFPTDVVTAANHDAQKTLHDAMIAALEDVTLGALDFEEFVGDRESIRPLVAAATAAAQVNIEWVVTYTDDVTSAVANVRIPCADITDDTLFMPNSNIWDPTDAKWVQFVTDFEAYILSEDGNAVSIQQIVYKQ